MINRFILSFYLFLFLLDTFSLLWSANPLEPDAHFNYYYREANAYYQKRQFIDALLLYEKLLTHKNYDAHLHYNVANTYYQLHKSDTSQPHHLAKSIYHYHQAIALKSDYQPARNNLTIVLEESLLEVDANLLNEPKNLFARLGILNIFSYQLLNPKIQARWLASSIFALAISICVFILSLWFRLSSSKHWIRIGLVGLNILAGCFYLMLVSKMFSSSPAMALERLNKQAIISAKNVETKIKPSDTEIIQGFELVEGQRVKIIKEKDGWVLIALANGNSGWIKTNEILIFNAASQTN